MERKYCSIFNDALGPVMTGPSSSHSAGCGRIGKTASGLWGRDILRADVFFEEKGSYPSTYIGQGSNFGFTGGLLGWDTDDPRLKDSVELAREMGRTIRFRKKDLGFHHPNEAEICVYNEDGSVGMSLLTYSIGGGMFEITRMDGFRVMIDGGSTQAFVRCVSEDAARETEKLLAAHQAEYTHEDREEAGRLYTVRFAPGQETEWLEALRAESGVEYLRYARPVMPVVRRVGSSMPFFNAAEALEYAEKHDMAIADLAAAYESALGVVDKEEIRRLTDKVISAMRRSTEAPDPDTTKMYGFLPYSARKMQKKLGKAKTFDTGLLGKAMMAAVAVMENSCAHNIIVASPTAGSSGVVPAGVVTLADATGASEEELRSALLAAGLVGVFIANQATFGGEVGACQAENGSASAMAAAGAAALLGGTVAECFASASLALQNMLGLICDPVAGLTEIPCISRNVSAVSNAVMSANMVLLGFDPVIPLDETIITMGKVGEMLPGELRCTCGGGLCTSPTGSCIQKRIDAERPVL